MEEREEGERRSDAATVEERQSALLTWTVYLVLAVFVVTEKFGRTTADTRLDMTEAPGQFLADTFSLWNPRVSLGELQNQAYGYLFPQGSFFALLEWIQVPGWVGQRIWSVLLLVVACEGMRRVARALSLGPWAASIAGLAYGLNPRHVAELGVRSAEILPGAVLPWALLPILHAVNGRMRPRTAALLSAAVYAFAGGVNGTATAAPVALLAVFVLWAWASGRLGWRFVLGWGALFALVNLWWVLSLLRLGAYSPPFFDYVEDARTTTESSGFSAALRGASNWVDYIVVNGSRWWPAGYDVSFNPWIVLATGMLAALGVLGLLRYRGGYRLPLLLSAALGLACLSIAHVGTLDSPFSQFFQDLLDGPLAPLRNVPKADPILRVPVCLGLAVLVEELVSVVRARAETRRGRVRRGSAGLLVGAVVLGLVGSAWPVLSGNLRTPGWEEIPDYWQETAAYLDESPAQGAAWVVPGSGFGIQTWGWTMEEPMQVLGRSPWVTRSQVPLTPAPTIRMLSQLENYLVTGAGSPYLRNMLDRIGVDRIVVRHDLDPEVSLATSSTLVAMALARSPGIDRVATFGELELGPAIEVFEVENAYGGSPARNSPFDVRDVADSVTVSSSAEDAIIAVGAGEVGDDQVMRVRGDSGWEGRTDIQGDAYRKRERAFGRVHQALSNVMTEDDEYRAGRVVPNYPGPPGAELVVAEYDGIRGVTASSSSGYADIIGPVHPEDAPWSALDGDMDTFWRPAPFEPARGQWVEIDLGTTRTLGRLELRESRAALGFQPVQRWRISAGGATVEVEPDEFTGVAEVDLEGVRADRLRIEVADVERTRAPVGLAEVEIEGVTPTRTLEVPPAEVADHPDFVFSAAPEVRACLTTLLGPDCDPGRARPSEAATGIDRTFSVRHGGTWRVLGLAVARSRPGTVELLRPQGGPSVTGSSWLATDPTVSPRMAHDKDPTTSWVADPRDETPVLTVDFGERALLRKIDVTPPADIAVAPTRAVITAGDEVRVVDLQGPGRFEPLRARRVTVELTRPGSDHFTLGVGDLRTAPAQVGVPLDGAAPTGAVCGFGPELVVDGRRVPTRVDGRIGSVVAAGQLAVRTCGKPVRLGPGRHRVRLLSTEQFQPVALELNSTVRQPRVERSRLLVVRSTSETRHVLDVGPGEEAIVSAPQSFNPGWSATIEGEELEPVQVDGWAQGWVLPEDRSGRLVLTFEPQRGYLVTLVVGLVLLGLVLVTAAVVGLRTRLTPGAPPSPSSRRGPPRGRRSGLVAGLAVVGVAYAVGGPVVAAGAAVGVLLASRPPAAAAVAAASLIGALVVLVVQVADDPGFPSAGVDLATGFGVAVALAAALLGPATRRTTRAG